MQQNKYEILSKFAGIYPVPVNDIATELGYSVKYFEPNSTKTKNVLVLINHKNKRIFINGADGEYQQRFNLAYAIAIILQRHNKDEEIDVKYRYS
jgi:hypothetical protein